MLVVVQTVVKTCALDRLPIDDEIDSAIEDIESFILDNSSAPVTQDQIDQHQTEEASPFVNSWFCQVKTRESEVGELMALVQAMREQDPVSFAANTKDMLSVPREPVLNPCL